MKYHLRDGGEKDKCPLCTLNLHRGLSQENCGGIYAHLAR